jgi:hypothetical protein
MPVLINGRSCLPIGARVYQIDLKDPRVVAAAMLVPLILALAGTISCGTAVVIQDINVFIPNFALTFQETITIGFRQIRVQANIMGYVVDNTSYITQACPAQPGNQPWQASYPCIGPISGDSITNICILPAAVASFTASQVFSAFAIIMQLLLPVLVVLNKVQSRSFAACSWLIVVLLTIAVCCAVLGAQAFENCMFNTISPNQGQQQGPQPTISYTTALLSSSNSLIAAIFFQFFLWACVPPLRLTHINFATL